MTEILYQTTEKYTFFSSVCGPFSRLSHKTDLKNSERTEILQNISMYKNSLRVLNVKESDPIEMIEKSKKAKWIRYHPDKVSDP